MSTPKRPGPVAYIIAIALSAACVTLIVLRIGTYTAGIALGRGLNTITFVAATVTGILAMALFWHIDRQHQKVVEEEATRQARWNGYGQAAQDFFDPDTSDTIDLARWR